MLNKWMLTQIDRMAKQVAGLCKSLGYAVEDVKQDMALGLLEAMPSPAGSDLNKWVLVVLKNKRADLLRRAPDNTGPEQLDMTEGDVLTRPTKVVRVLQLSSLVEDEGFDAVDGAVVMRF